MILDAAVTLRRTQDTRQALLSRLRRAPLVSGHQIVARSLVANGITHVYGVPGRPIDATLAACARAGIRVIGARHQQGAALMSVSHNYVAGGLRSAVIVSAGPAVTNTATGLLVAHDNRWPLLVMGGRKSPAAGHEGAFQAFDGSGFFSPVTKHASVSIHADDLAGAIGEGCRLATEGAPGPVYLDLDEEALTGRTRPGPREFRQVGETVSRARLSVPPQDALREAAASLSAARRPVLLIGKGIRWSGDWTHLRRIVDEARIPFAAAPMARGFLPDDHPLCVTLVRGQALAEADLVLMVGARLNWTFHHGIEIPPDARVLRIDIDPVESRQVLGRGTALPGDAAATLALLVEALESTSARARRDDGWLARIQALRDEARALAESPAASETLPMSPGQWLREVRDGLPASAITVLDGNVVMAAAQAIIPALAPLSRITAATNGCMGVGIPFAIGAKLAAPDRPVVAICGDFAFGLNAFELETAVRHSVPITVIVANNGGPGGSTRQRGFFGPECLQPIARFSQGVRHDLAASALGARGVRVTRPGELSSALREALADGPPSCIDVLTNEDTPLSPVI